MITGNMLGSSVVLTGVEGNTNYLLLHEAYLILCDTFSSVWFANWQFQCEKFGTADKCGVG